MLKAGLYVDGGFFHALTGLLRRRTGNREYRMDLHGLSGILAKHLGSALGGPVCVTARRWYATEPVAYDAADESVAQGIQDFHAHLRALAGWDVVTFPMNHAGRRIRPEMRDPDDDFHPQDRFVPVALTAGMVQRAAIPGAMDVLLLAAGDVGYAPACRTLRAMGQMVWICGAEAICAPSLLERNVAEPACDGWLALDEMADEIALDGQSPRRGVQTDRADRGAQDETEIPADARRGRIKTLIADKGYGFLESADGRDYFFHANELESPLIFEDLEVGDIVGFYIESEGQAGKAGKVSMVLAPGA